MLSLLLSMPIDVTRDQIAPFFDLLSLVRLDSATLSKEHRSNLLTCVLEEALISESDIQYKKDQFDWFIRRGIELVEIQFSAESVPADLDHATPVLRVAEILNLTDCVHLTNKCVQQLVENISPGLQLLLLGGCAWVNDETLRVASDLHGAYLSIFDLGSCFQITDAGAAYSVSKCPNVEDVKWDFCGNVGTLAMAALAQHRLVTLRISSCPNITEDVLIEILQGNEDKLEILTFTGNSQLTDRTLLAIAEHCPSLQKLEVPENERFTDAGLSAVIESCQCLTIFRVDSIGSTPAVLDCLGSRISPALEVLFVGGSPLLTDDHVAAITARASKLREIRIGESEFITDRSLQSIGANLPGLTNASIQICNNVAYPGVEALVRGCPLLVEVDLGMCPEVCDRCLDVIATHCKHLVDFTVTDNDVITDAGVRNIARKCTKLLHVNFDYTSITNSAVEYMIRKCPKLLTVGLVGHGQVSRSLHTLAVKRNIELLL